MKRKTTMVESVRQAVAAMFWLTPSDEALVTLAVKYAEAVDAGQVFAGPHLFGALKALGGTPAARRELGVETKVGGRLAELRAHRGGAS